MGPAMVTFLIGTPMNVKRRSRMCTSTSLVIPVG
jgi:hypothetical protein